MPTYLTLLGRPQIEHDGIRVALPGERRGQLLALLALRRGWVARSELAAVLWPGHRGELAATNLRKALHLARALPGTGSLEVQPGLVRLHVATDVQDVQAAHREGRIADALGRCRGELLDGLEDASNPAWTAWLDAERAEHARRWHELTRIRLRQLHSEPGDAAALARRLLDADPLDEDAVVALLTAQRELGQFDEQREAYHSFVVRLEEELGIEPSLRVRQQFAAAALPAGAQGSAPIVPGEGFFGRAKELDELAALLARQDCRLVTVLGPGGVGKSSLLEHALRRLEPLFADGVFWIALDDLHVTAQIAARIASELRLTPGPQQPPLALVREHLATRRTLLVLDNAEHLDDLARFAAQLLADTTHLKICATSRVRLAVRGEALLPLGGLALPPEQAAPGELLASEAAQLFVASAVATRPDFDARAQAPSIVALVRATGGLPLALLLAAHWVRLLPVTEIVAELERSLDVLDSADSAEERPEHRSMRATFERSWQMLAAREQRALAELSVFVGSFTREAAHEVCAASLPLLAALADKSLLQMLAGGRCALHPLIRQFAAAKLESPARGDALRRHASWFHRFLERAGPGAEAAEQKTLDQIGNELENCRQAWRWAIDVAATAQIGASTVALKQFFGVRGRVAEGLELLGEARRVAAPVPACAARLAAAMAQLEYRVSRLEQAAATARQGIHFARIAGERGVLARCLGVLGTCCWQWGRNIEAKRYLEQAMRYARACGDARSAVVAQANLGLVEKALGNYARAKAVTFEWVAAQREQGEWLRVAVGLNNLAYICNALGDFDASRGFLDEGLMLCEQHGLLLPRPALLVNLSGVYAATGRLDDAESVAREVIAVARADSYAEVETAALNQLVRIAIRRGDIEQARVRLHVAARAAAATRNEEVQLDSVFCFARILAAERNAREAAPLLRLYLARPNLEPIDRCDAQACLAGLPADGADAAPVAEPLAALLQRVISETAGAASATPLPSSERRGTPGE